MKTSRTMLALVVILGAALGMPAFAEEPGADVKPVRSDRAVEDALAPAAIAERIERYRKGELTVIVQDAQGKAVANATVHLAQTRHGFLFGCNIFELRPDQDTPLQKAYQDQFVALLNYATLPFYWGGFEPQQGKPQYERLDAMARWCVAHGITPKGHPLIWSTVWPKWAPKDPDAAIPLLRDRVTDIVIHYKDTIHYWDVVNEANSPGLETGEGAWIKRDGAATVVGTALDWVRAAGKGNPETFIYNDWCVEQPNVALLTHLQEAGKLPDAIGIQSHMHFGKWPMKHVWEVCETFSRFKRPLHFTETTVISGPKRERAWDAPAEKDWLTTPEGEVAQADYGAKLYTLLFSHPAVHAITWWDFSDHAAWQGAPGGMLRRDMSPKPLYGRLMQLIHKDWWTTAQGPTNELGRYGMRVFYGDYTITAADAAGRVTTEKISFPEGAEPRQVVVQLP